MLNKSIKFQKKKKLELLNGSHYYKKYIQNCEEIKFWGGHRLLWEVDRENVLSSVVENIVWDAS